MPKRFGRPSPALVISLIALFVALGGSAVADIATMALTKAEKKQTKKIATKVATKQANKQITKRAPGLSVASANTAKTAGSAPPSGPAGGALSGTYPNPTLGADSVGAAEIAADVVSSSELGTITQRSATSTTIAAGKSGSATVDCLPGEQILSGGNDGFVDVWVAASRRSGTNGWAVFAFNNSAVNRTVTVHAYCLAP